jgi:hypothetical protein
MKLKFQMQMMNIHETHNIGVFLLNLTTYIINHVSKEVACSPSILMGARLILAI